MIKTGSDILLYIFCFILFVSIFIAAGALLTYLHQNKIESWSLVPAKVIRSEITTVYKYPEMNTSGPAVQKELWSLNIEFEYVYQGVKFTSTSITSSTENLKDKWRSSSKPTYMLDLLNEYPLDKDVKILVNPENPHASYVASDYKIFKKFSFVALAFFSIGIVGLAFCLSR